MVKSSEKWKAEEEEHWPEQGAETEDKKYPAFTIYFSSNIGHDLKKKSHGNCNGNLHFV